MAAFMHEAASAGDAETLRRLLDQGVSPEDVALLYGGRTPLHWLCYSSNEGGDRIACFELLRAAGANLDATDRKGCVPLHYAVQRRSSSLASLLIEAGVNVNVTNLYGATPLHYAGKCGSETTVAMLIKAGAEVNAKDDWGKRPLHNARDYDNTRICHILLRAGATLVPCPKCEPPRPHLPLSRRTSTEQYLRRVTDAGGFKEYRHNHLVKFTSCSSKLRLPAAPARLVAEFWAHAGYY